MRETYENSWFSGGKKHAKNTEDYRVKWERQKRHKNIDAYTRVVPSQEKGRIERVMGMEKGGERDL